MTAAFLQSELSSLISESKRKNADIRSAAERSLSDLKSISVTSENQLAADLRRRPSFIDPFLAACTSKNAKLANSATVCLQRLSATKAIPVERLEEVVNAFADVSTMGTDVQLKILQTLPGLVQLYTHDVHGRLLSLILDLCAGLQQSKTSVISNTAAATFQQLVATIFERVASIEGGKKSKNDKVSNGTSESVETFSEDADKMFADFCSLLNNGKPTFIRMEKVSAIFLLQIVDGILSHHEQYLVRRPDQLKQCRLNLLPGMNRLIQGKESFPVVARLLRVIYLLLRNYSSTLRNELQDTLSYLVNALDRDVTLPWKRALVLEFFRGLCSDFVVLRRTFALFDARSNQTPLIANFMASLVRIAAEDPTLIGLGRQSTVPTQSSAEARSDELASIEAAGMGGTLTSVTSADTRVTGISFEWSVLSPSLIDQPDRTTPPDIPSTYIFALVLDCIASFCDGLSRFVMPISVSNRSRNTVREEPADVDGLDEEGTISTRVSNTSTRAHRLTNPLTLQQHPQFNNIQLCAEMIDACWPAILASCSTFLNAALDSHFYHVLIRSVQKLAQVSGVLELSTPRDALLTSVAKASVPANASAIISVLHSDTSNNIKGENTNLANLISPSMERPSFSFETVRQAVNIRHLLCLRALLNLGIALGPTLGLDSWYIVLETLQQVEALMQIPGPTKSGLFNSTRSIAQVTNDGSNPFGAEINAVQLAAKRLFESTRNYDNDMFACVVEALFRLSGPVGADQATVDAEQATASTVSPEAKGRPRGHRPSQSTARPWRKSRILDIEIEFVLQKLGEMSRINLERFLMLDAAESTWGLIVEYLLKIAALDSLNVSLRVQAASTVDIIAIECVKSVRESDMTEEEVDTVQQWCIGALLEQLKFIQPYSESLEDEARSLADLEIHKRLLEALESIISHNGEALRANWALAFQVLSWPFEKSKNQSDTQQDRHTYNTVILPTAFKSIQLIASDFPTSLDVQSLSNLARLLYYFGAQQVDLNISLTTSSLLLSLASTIQRHTDHLELSRSISNAVAHSLPHEDEQSGGSTILWATILQQLSNLCVDARENVRNACIEVMMQMFDISRGVLDSKSWNISLRDGPLSVLGRILDSFKDHSATASEWQKSVARLVTSTSLLISQNMQAISVDPSFAETWLELMKLFDSILQSGSLEVYELIYKQLALMLAASASIQYSKSQLIQLPLRLWCTYGPTSHTAHEIKAGGNEQPNEIALQTHLHMVVEAFRVDPVAVKTFVLDNENIEVYLHRTIREATTHAAHPAFSNDIKRLSPEQAEVVLVLSILKEILEQNLGQFIKFILELVQTMLNIEGSNVALKSRDLKPSRKSQQPTFIAACQQCLEILQTTLLEASKRSNFLDLASPTKVLNILAAIIATKYTPTPTNPDSPLWKTATEVAIVLIERTRVAIWEANPLTIDLNALAKSINATIKAILNAEGLSSKQSTNIGLQNIEAEEGFDIQQFQKFHAQAVNIISFPEISDTTRKEYVMIIFHASLLAEPWYFDFPDDLIATPLAGFTKVRAGSVHKLVFKPRPKLSYMAIAALSELVSADARFPGTNHASTTPDSKSGRYSNPTPHQIHKTMAHTAAPYFLLRVSHSIKTFLVDQPLRNLTPPSRTAQKELASLLAGCLRMKVDDEAFVTFSASLSPNRTTSTTTLRNYNDGKTHLRLLHGLILRTHALWIKLPRLKTTWSSSRGTGEGGGGAWQDDKEGRTIEMALDMWSRVLGEEWMGNETTNLGSGLGASFLSI